MVEAKVVGRSLPTPSAVLQTFEHNAANHNQLAKHCTVVIHTPVLVPSRALWNLLVFVSFSLLCHPAPPPGLGPHWLRGEQATRTLWAWYEKCPSTGH